MKIFITGGTSGIGKQTVELLSTQSHQVIFSGRDQKRGDELAMSTNSEFIRGDISTCEGCEDLANRYFELHAHCDVLINNAGIWTEGTIGDTSVQEIEKVFSINSIAPIILSKLFIAKMDEHIQEGSQEYGRIIFVNSVAGLTSKAEREVYCASKWAITGFTKGLSQELSDHKISITNLCPGSVDTELFDNGGYPRDTSAMMDPKVVANAIGYIINQPADVQIQELVVHPTSYI